MARGRPRGGAATVDRDIEDFGVREIADLRRQVDYLTRRLGEFEAHHVDADVVAKDNLFAEPDIQRDRRWELGFRVDIPLFDGGEMGHRQAECSQGCGEIGHRQAECPKVSSSCGLFTHDAPEDVPVPEGDPVFDVYGDDVVEEEDETEIFERVRSETMAEFIDMENQDGVRMPWNVIPGTEYGCPSEKSVVPPMFFFVVDTCIIEEEMGYLKSALSQAVDLLPDNSLVGLITFGTYVHVHDLGFGQVPKSYAFRGRKEVTKDQLLEQMSFFAKKQKPPTGVIAGARDGLAAESIARFLLPASDCDFALNSVLEDLQNDPWPVPSDVWAPRCTSTALGVAASLLGACVPGSGARIKAFVGGPSTEGPGAIVSKTLTEPIRSHKDLDNDSAPLFHKAVKFYEGLSKQLVNQGHVLDVFACALDQVGMAELKVAVEKTGGLVVLAESFGHSVFKDSIKRVFQSGEHDLGLAMNGIFEINCSKDIKVHGNIGPCASLEKKGPLSSETIIGQGNTSAWKMCGLDQATSLCVVFDIAKKESPDAINHSSNSQFYFQFLTYYQHPNGQMRLRSTTLSRRWVAGPGSVQDLTAGFDQEAAAVVMARLVSFKMETEAEFDPIRWLDKSLIRMCSRFGDYQEENPSSHGLVYGAVPRERSDLLTMPSHVRTSDVFKVKHLILFQGASSDTGMGSDSRTNLFDPGGDDADRLAKNQDCGEIAGLELPVSGFSP